MVEIGCIWPATRAGVTSSTLWPSWSMPRFSWSAAFTLVGHDVLDRLLDRPALKLVLEGVTAAVVGLIAATALELLLGVMSRPLAAVVFAAALGALFRWQSKLVVPAVIGAAALIGLLFGGC